MAQFGEESKVRFGGLLNAEELHRTYPASFSIPRSGPRRSLTAGSLAKLLFRVGDDDPPRSEHMWVEVTEVRLDGYVGRLDNDPTLISDLRPDAVVPFGPENIAAIYRPNGPLDVRPEQFAVVSDRLVAGGGWPVRLERRDVPDSQFSGWFLFAEGDPLVPPPDMAGFQPVTHYEIDQRWRSFDSVQDEPSGTEWIWDPAAVEWVRSGEAG